METYDSVLLELDSIDRHLSRRKFLKILVLVATPVRLALDSGDREFLRKLAATLIIPEALSHTGIDVIANVEHLLERGSAEHRAKVLRLLTWARRVSFLYGGENVARRGRDSRFVLIQKLSKALSALCLVSFWGDERSLQLIEPQEAQQ
jgi:hypothetical protein